jgi:hypothetical protein
MTEKPRLSVVKTLYDSSLLDVPAKLRALAEEVEAGKYGQIGTCAVSMLGDRLNVFAFGSDSSGPSAAIVLHAGFNMLARPIEQHGE